MNRNRVKKQSNEQGMHNMHLANTRFWLNLNSLNNSWVSKQGKVVLQFKSINSKTTLSARKQTDDEWCNRLVNVDNDKCQIVETRKILPIQLFDIFRLKLQIHFSSRTFKSFPLECSHRCSKFSLIHCQSDFLGWSHSEPI